jgi:hypothetical protein
VKNLQKDRYLYVLVWLHPILLLPSCWLCSQLNIHGRLLFIFDPLLQFNLASGSCVELSGKYWPPPAKKTNTPRAVPHPRRGSDVSSEWIELGFFLLFLGSCLILAIRLLRNKKYPIWSWSPRKTAELHLHGAPLGPVRHPRLLL